MSNDYLMLNGINVIAYKDHPRVVELRLLMIYNVFMKEYGSNDGVLFFRALCDLWHLEWSKLDTIIHSAHETGRTSLRKRYNEEKVFSCLLYGDPITKVAKMTGVSRTSLYGGAYGYYHRLDTFITNEWLRDLANNVGVCGIAVYKNEAMRFLDNFSKHLRFIKNVFISKTQL